MARQIVDVASLFVGRIRGGLGITTILGYTALASTIGGGGLGTLAIVKGLNIRKYDMMYSASLMLVFLVQIITVFGTRTTRSLDHKHR